MQDLDIGPLLPTPAVFSIMFIAREKSGTEVVQLVIMPFSRRCQSVVDDPYETLNQNLFWSTFFSSTLKPEINMEAFFLTTPFFIQRKHASASATWT